LEYIKIQLQIDKSPNGSAYEIVRKVINSKGVTGMYKGFWAHFNRDVISYGVYFYCYFKFIDLFVKDDSRVLAFCAGGIAGIVSWLNCYPFDPIKTLIQTTNNDKTLTQYQAYKIIVNERGVKGLFRGINPVLFRAFFVHSIVFYTNGLFRKYFAKYKI
jgi:solute carrier family 25 carnitine/acylcarnitine transporter 20/29